MPITNRQRAEYAIFELYNVAEHVDKGSQIAKHELEYKPAAALAALENVRESAARIEMHLSDAIQAIKTLIDDPDRSDHPGWPDA